MEASGELPKGTSHTWAHHTKDMKALPEHKESSAKAKDFAPLNPGGTAEKHPDMPVPKDEVQAGVPVEKEHTTSTQKARAIAVDHVVEIPDYYKRLKKLETQAEEDGVKRADAMLRRFEALPGQQQEELDAATAAANNALSRQRVLGEIGAGVGGALSAVPGLGLLMPSYGEFRNDARSALEAKAEEHAQNLGDLQTQHASEATQLLDQLRARGKLAFDQTQTSTMMGAAPRGDELHLPMGPNPYMGDPKASSEFENGFDYAQALGHQSLNQATEGDVQRWLGSANAWRDGFAEACTKLGLARVGDLVRPQAKTATIPSALEPAGHWSRLAGGALGAGAGIAAHSLYGDPGELYTLVPPALAGIAAGTIAGDMAHSMAQRGDVDPDAPIRRTDDPRVRVPQSLAAMAGMGLGAGLGYLGGHELAPASWHDTAGGFAPEIVGTSVGGVGGAMASSALENRLSGRDKRGHYTLSTTEAHMTSIAPMTADNAKLANAMLPLLGALGGAAGGAMIAPHVSQLGDFVSQHHTGMETPEVAAEADRLPQAIPLTPEEKLHMERLYGAGIGGGLGLAGGMAANAMSPDEERRQPMMRMAEAKVAHLNLLKDIDGDVEGSATDALAAKLAGIGTTLGTLGGIGGGALAGNYLAPAMHWAAMPGEGAATHSAIGALVQPQLEAAAHGGGNISANITPEQLQALQQGMEAQRGTEWGGTADIGRVMGAGVGGVAGYQAGRGLDEAFGLEKKERPLVISPMSRSPLNPLNYTP